MNIPVQHMAKSCTEQDKQSSWFEEKALDRFLKQHKTKPLEGFW